MTGSTRAQHVPTLPDLAARIARAVRDDERPIAFLLGAGVSVGSVPGTPKIVDFMRQSVADDAEDLHDFDERLATLHQPAHRYQAAAEFIIHRAGLDQLNRVVRAATLAARSPGVDPAQLRALASDERRLRELEEDWNGWAIPRGLRYLGALLREMPPERRGPILTTNFDPLVEVACRAAGLETASLVLDGDGSTALPDLPNLIQVVHLHGFWREGDTLHTVAQLGQPRPKLTGVLRRLLTSSVCVISGYSGWDDVFTRSLHQVVEQGDTRAIEVLWASYGPVPELGPLEREVLPGRLQTYIEVNFNQLCEDVLRRLGLGAKPLPRGTGTRFPTPTGWEVIDAPRLEAERRREVTPSEALAFFDGRQPIWRDVLGRHAPMLSSGRALLGLVREDSRAGVLVLGPTGEGKSTAVRQVAAELAAAPDWRVLWHVPAAPVRPDELITLPRFDGRYLLAVDDADLMFGDLAGALPELARLGRDDIMVLLASRDTDWSRASDFARRGPNSTLGLRVHPIGGVSRDDAMAITTAWAAYGEAGLGALADIPRADDRAEKLLEYAASPGTDQRGDLLGSLLLSRHGGDLREHVRVLLARLSRIVLPGDRTLTEAFMVICLPELLNCGPVDVPLLCRMLGLEPFEVDSLVLQRLGREAAASRHGDQVLPRHPALATVALGLAGDFGLETTEAAAGLVTAAIDMAEERGWSEDQVYRDIAYSSQRLSDRHLAVTTAQAAVDHSPRQLRFRINLAHVMRNADDLRGAQAVCDRAWLDREQLLDLRIAERNFLREWARISGLLSRWADSVGLTAVSLLDLPQSASLDEANAYRALSGMALSLSHLHSDDRDFCRHVGACAEAALSLRCDGETRRQAQRSLDLAIDRGYKQGDFVGDVYEALRVAVKVSQVRPALAWKRRSLAYQQLRRLLE